MRYIAKKNKDLFTVTGIKEMETIDGDKVDVLYASKDYDKKKLEEVIETLTKEKDSAMERYEADIDDLNAMLEAIKEAK